MLKTQVVTASGANLIRDAVAAGKKIVFTRAKATGEHEMDRGALCYKDASWYALKDGSVSVVSGIPGHIHVTASFSATSGADDPIKSICLCAQLSKDGDNPSYDAEDDVVVAAMSDDNSCFNSGKAFSVDFEVAASAADLFDAVGRLYNPAGLEFVSWTPGEDDKPGTLRVKLSDGKQIDLSGTLYTPEA